MRKVSDSRAYTAERNALMAQQHGEVVVALGKTLQGHSIITDYGYQIEVYGLLIGEYAQQSLMYALLLPQQGVSSPDLFIKASQARLEVSKLLVQAIKLYLKASKARADFRN